MNEPPIALANRLQCLFDLHVVDEAATTARVQLHQPTRREPVIVHDKPWEGSTSGYHVIVQDGDLYRMYYRGESGITLKAVVCYAESRDGLHWEKPSLGICEFEGSRDNNIIADAALHPYLDNFYVFKDENPDCPPDRLYKAASFYDFPNSEMRGLRAYYSPDGIHFCKGDLILDKSVGAFDSVNVIFWDAQIGKYRCYFRGYHPAPAGTPCSATGNEIRDVRYTESTDFVNWSEPVILLDSAHADISLYTNNVQRYYRAPHQFIGLPTRYIERVGWSDGFEELCGKEERLARIKRFCDRVGLTVTECGFMASPDGVNFRKFDEAFCPPLPENGTNWLYGDCYFAYGMIETPASFLGADPEISLYSLEHYWMEPAAMLTRYTLRRDGFVSLRADREEKTVLTKPFTYEGNTLYVNLSTSAWGYAYFTLIDQEGNRYSSSEYFGNSTRKHIRLPEDAVAKNAGKPVRLEVRLRDADFYSFRFANE